MTSAQPINLCFHGIGEPTRDLECGERDYWISAGLFTDILDLIGQRPDVTISFDDGNASDAEIGLPELRRRGLTATFYPVAGRIGQPGSVDDAAVRALVDGGMAIGNHGMWHVPWRRLSEAQLDEELIVARGAIEDVAGTKIDVAACPFGAYDRRVLTRLRRLGYSHVFTSDRSRTPRQSWLQPRYSVLRTDTLESIRTILSRAPSRSHRAHSSLRIAAKRLR